MADHVPTYACGWETGLVREVNHVDLGPSLTTPACMTVVAAAGTLMQGSYMLNIDYTAARGSTTRNLSMGAASSGAIGFDIEFVSDVDQDAGIIAVDNGNLNGWFLRKQASDQKLIICDQNNVVKLTSANAYTTGEFHIQVKWTPRTVEMRIYDSTLSLDEELSVFFIQSASSTLRLGHVSGTEPTEGEFNMDNIYVIKTAGAWPPIHPTFEALPVNSGPGSDNSTAIFESSSGADDSTGEWEMLDEIPPTITGTTDYVYKNTGGIGAAAQYYGHAGFGLGTPEFITVGVVNLWERANTATAAVTARIKLSTSTLFNGTGSFNTANGFRYEHPGFWITKPGGGDWAAADVDNALPGHGILNFTGGTQIRGHQLIIYAIYGDDVELDRLTMPYRTMVG